MSNKPVLQSAGQNNINAVMIWLNISMALSRHSKIIYGILSDQPSHTPLLLQDLRKYAGLNRVFSFKFFASSFINWLHFL